MLCATPYMKGELPCACGSCLPCRINKRRLWQNRILLEAMSHGDNVFATLTYNEENLPENGSLEPWEAQKFIKRLRKRIGKEKIRYFIVGEYGDRSQRPHYHVVLFGHPNCLRGRTEHRIKKCCQICEIIKKAWNKGGIDLGEVNKKTAQYISGYVTKKMTRSLTEEQVRYLNGREPEFARMSLRPGIGAKTIERIAKSTEKFKSYIYEKYQDVPISIKIGGRDIFIGRYLRSKWRAYLGKKSEAPEEVLKQYKEEVSRLLRETKEKIHKKEERYFASLGRRGLNKFLFVDKDRQKIVNMEGRQKIYTSKRTI